MLLLLGCYTVANGQETHVLPLGAAKSDTVAAKPKLFHKYKEMDIIDVALEIANKTSLRHIDTTAKKKGKLYIAPLPGIGYSLNTGLAAVLNTNFAFYTSAKQEANISSIVTSINVTQMNQFILPILSNIWLDDNKYNIQGNWLYAKFPQATFGLGGHTNLTNTFNIDYSNIRLQTALYRAIAPDLLLGLGYTYEYFWNISQVSQPTGDVTDMTKYGFTPTSTSSAPTLNLLYDTRHYT